MSFARLALTQSATLLGLTPAIVGFVLARNLGLPTAVASMLLACTITCVLASLSALVAVSYKAPTATLSGVLLGAGGPRLVGMALAISAMGFFGVHTIALLQALPALSPGLAVAWPKAPIVLSCALGSVALVYRGNARIAGINSIQAPLVVLSVLWAAWHHSHGNVSALWTLNAAHIDWPSVAMVVAAGLGDVVDLPSVMHRAHSVWDAVLAAWFTYGLVLPTLLVAGALLACDAQAGSALLALADGSGSWRIVVCLLAISCATVGNANLVYSGGLSVAAALRQSPRPAHRLAVGSAAALLSLTPLTDRLPPLLDALGLATGAVGTSLLTNFLLDGAKPIAHASPRRTQACAWACSLGTCLGVGTFAVLTQSNSGLAVAVACASACIATGVARLFSFR